MFCHGSNEESILTNCFNTSRELKIHLNLTYGLRILNVQWSATYDAVGNVERSAESELEMKSPTPDSLVDSLFDQYGVTIIIPSA